MGWLLWIYAWAVSGVVLRTHAGRDAGRRRGRRRSMRGRKEANMEGSKEARKRGRDAGRDAGGRRGSKQGRKAESANGTFKRRTGACAEHERQWRRPISDYRSPPTLSTYRAAVSLQSYALDSTYRAAVSLQPYALDSTYRAAVSLQSYALDSTYRAAVSLQSYALEEIVTLVVDQDEGGEIFDADLPDGFHAEFREFHAFYALDVFLRKDRGYAADGTKIESAWNSST